MKMNQKNTDARQQAQRLLRKGVSPVVMVGFDAEHRLRPLTPMTFLDGRLTYLKFLFEYAGKEPPGNIRRHQVD